MKIDLWSIERVKPYDRNPRQNDQAVEAVAASLTEFGWHQSIVVDKRRRHRRRSHPLEGGEGARLEESSSSRRRGPAARAGQGVPLGGQLDGHDRRAGQGNIAPQIGRSECGRLRPWPLKLLRGRARRVAPARTGRFVRSQPLPQLWQLAADKI
jgi:hypothetical protein